MVGRITTGADIKGLLEYIFKEDAEVLDQSVFSDTIDSIVHEFNMISECNQKVEKPVKHFVLSFAESDGEKLNNEQLIEIAKNYLELMGYSNNQHLLVKHNDTDKLHLHIAVNRVDLDLKCVADSFEKMRSRTILRQLEKEYNLEETAEAGKGKEVQEQGVGKLKSNSLKTVQYISNKELTKAGKSKLSKDIYRELKSGKYTNFEEFQDSLKGRGIDLSFKNKGNVVVFTFDGVNINGGELYKKLSKHHIEQEFRSHILSDLRTCIKTALGQNKSGREEFFKTLENLGVQIQMNSSKKGYSFSYAGQSFKASAVNRNLTLSKIDSTLEKRIQENAKDYIKKVIFQFSKAKGSENFPDFLNKKDIAFYERIKGEAKFLYNDIVVLENELKGVDLAKSRSMNFVHNMVCEAIDCSNNINDFHEYLESKSIVAEIGENKFIYKYDGFDFDLGTESFINFIESKFPLDMLSNLPEQKSDPSIPLHIGNSQIGEQSDEEEEEIKRKNASKGMEI